MYFFPSTEQLIVRLQNQIISRVHYIYGFYFIKGTILLVLKLREALDEDEENLKRIEFLQTFNFMIFNSALLLSSFLYIPIMISIRKNKHLPTVRQSNPQKYIMYQTLIMILFRATSPVLIVLCLTAQFDHVSVLFYIIDLTDILITPFTIMFSYLSCNKQNVVTMFRPVTSRFKKLFGKCFKNSVQPTIAPDLARNN